MDASEIFIQKMVSSKAIQLNHYIKKQTLGHTVVPRQCNLSSIPLLIFAKNINLKLIICAHRIETRNFHCAFVTFTG